MKLLISAPSGFNTREILLPLAPFLETDADIESVVVMTPAAELKDRLFCEFSTKFSFIKNPATLAEHENILKGLGVDLVLTPTNGLDSYDTPLLRAAKNVGIVTCTFVASWDNVYKMERALRTGRDNVLPDYLGVWNEMMRSHVLRIYPELTPDRVRIIGTPRFDFFFHTDKIPSEATLREQIGIPQNNGKLIHCATTELYPLEYVVRAIAEANESKEITPKLHLYASVHPGGKIEKHEVYKKYGAVVQYSFGRREDVSISEFRYMPTYKEIYTHMALFKYASILVNQSSTVAIESMLANVPVINVKYGQPFDWWRWRRSMVYRDFNEHYRDIINGGGTTIVTNRKQLIQEINHYLDDPSYKQAERAATIKKMITYTDGQSSQRLIDYIKEILHK